MSDRGGYVRLFRKLLKNPIWNQCAPAVAKVAIFFLLRASYRSMQWYDGAATVEIPAGALITSLGSAATACNISKQQARDAFEHLSRTQFATYRRTHRWTLVTVVNWASYQASPEGGNTLENTEETAHGTPNKKKRRKEYTSPLLSDEGAAREIPSDPDELPFATPLDDPLPIESANGNDHSASKGTDGCAAEVQEVLQRIARQIHQRHPKPRRDIGAGQVEKQLAGILKYRRIPLREQIGYLGQIDRNHAGRCATDDWLKDGGEFAKGLENWLAPTKGRYDVEPPTTSATPPPRIVL